MSRKVKKVIKSRKKNEERVMVVSREDMFSLGGWHGLKTKDLKKYLSIISRKHKFLARSSAEEDPMWQQIIPYLIFETAGKYFVMQRKGDHTDTRLANKISIGIGGHINKSDIKSTSIVDWAKREFEEEVEYKGKYKTEFLGLINDDSNNVGLVHLGLVIKISGDSSEIAVRDEHKFGKLKKLSSLAADYKNMETWSQIVYDFLRQKTVKKVKSKVRQSPKQSLSPSSIAETQNNVVGILPDWVITEYVVNNKIQISPLSKKWRENIDQVSIDFHLGNKLKLFRGGAYRFVDTRRGLPDDAMEEVRLNEGDPFILEPGAFAITSTKEILKLPTDILGRLEGKSSLARLGILVHSTAARFDPGWNGAPVLELGNLGPKPAILYCGMPICAFTFEKLASPVRMKYEGSRSDRYSGSKAPLESKIEKHGPSKRTSGHGKKKR